MLTFNLRRILALVSLASFRKIAGKFPKRKRYSAFIAGVIIFQLIFSSFPISYAASSSTPANNSNDATISTENNASTSTIISNTTSPKTLSKSKVSTKVKKAGVQLSAGKAALYFEANKGQTDSQVKFLARAAGYNLYLTNDASMVLDLQKPVTTTTTTKPASPKTLPSQKITPTSRAGSVLKISFMGANNNPKERGVTPFASKTNYITGKDKNKWQNNIVSYASVQYKQVYKGIDLTYTSDDKGQLEFSFTVAPKTDPKTIALKIDGADKIDVSKNGTLTIQSGGLTIQHPVPVAYQMINGKRKTVAAQYTITGTNQIGFKVGPYSRALPLIIDPTVIYSSFISGSGNYNCAGDGPCTPIGDNADAFTIDSNSNIYVTGLATSPDFPTTTGAYQTTNPYYGNGDNGTPFVSKLSADGSTLLYSTYLATNALPMAIAVDSNGQAIVAGFTWGLDPRYPQYDYPTTAGAYQQTIANYDQYLDITAGFITKLSADGSSLVYSTLLSGDNGSMITSLALDTAGNVFVAGYAAYNFPITSNAFYQGIITADQASGSWSVPFISELDSTGSQLKYSSFLDANNVSLSNIVSNNNLILIGGTTQATDIPTTSNAYEATIDGTISSSFVLELNTNLTGSNSIVYGTYLFNNCTISDLATDNNGYIYITGSAGSNFPTTTTFTANAVSSGGFIAKLNPTLSGSSQLVYSAILPGTNGGSFIAADNNGNAYVTGSVNILGIVNNGTFPLTPDIYQPPFDVNGNYYIAMVNTTLTGTSALPYAARFNSFNGDVVGLVRDANGYIYVAGSANSFPASTGAYNSGNIGFGGVFALKFLINGGHLDGYNPSQLLDAAGDGQSALVNYVFTTPLAITVEDGQGDLLSGASVTFTAPDPTSNASGIFQDTNTNITTVYSDDNGVATAPNFVANSMTGSYTVIATVAGTSSQVTFSLNNQPDPPVKVYFTTGLSQSALLGNQSVLPFGVEVLDSNDNPLSNIGVQFTVEPANAANGIAEGFFASNNLTDIEYTNNDGSGAITAISSNFTAGNVEGTFKIKASLYGVDNSPYDEIYFTNIDSDVTGSVTSGNNQSAIIYNSFSKPFAVKITDAAGEGLPNLSVTFAAPASDPSGYFTDSHSTSYSAFDNGDGTYKLYTGSAFIAGSVVGKYANSVEWTATTTSGYVVASGDFGNIANTGVPNSISVIYGDNQSTEVNTAFATPLKVLVQDASGTVVQGAIINFSNNNGAGAIGSTSSYLTGPDGTASDTFTANTVAGNYSLQAQVSDSNQNTYLNVALFSLTNTSSDPTQIVAVAGTQQNANVNTSFAIPLQVKVTDTYGNSVPNVPVTYQIGHSIGLNGVNEGGYTGGDATGIFSGINSNNPTVIFITDANGYTQPPNFTANSNPGMYYVFTSIPLVVQNATFLLINNYASYSCGRPISGDGPPHCYSNVYWNSDPNYQLGATSTIDIVRMICGDGYGDYCQGDTVNNEIWLAKSDGSAWIEAGINTSKGKNSSNDLNFFFCVQTYGFYCNYDMYSSSYANNPNKAVIEIPNDYIGQKVTVSIYPEKNCQLDTPTEFYQPPKHIPPTVDGKMVGNYIVSFEVLNDLYKFCVYSDELGQSPPQLLILGQELDGCSQQVEGCFPIGNDPTWDTGYDNGLISHADVAHFTNNGYFTQAGGHGVQYQNKAPTEIFNSNPPYGLWFNGTAYPQFTNTGGDWITGGY